MQKIIRIIKNITKNSTDVVRAFSFVELLVTMITITCIIAAFSPVITRNFKSPEQVMNSKHSSLCSKFGPNCNFCSPTECLSCDIPSCYPKSGINVETCTCESTLDCGTGQTANSSNSGCCVNIDNCDSYNTSCNCTLCEDGSTPVNNKCDWCSGENFVRIGNLCTTKKNMGDSPVLTLPDTINITQANNSSSTCAPSQNHFCCWRGETANPNYCDISYGGYTGCSRTVCDWWAANEICSKYNYKGYKWRLPISAEMSEWDNYAAGRGSNALWLCHSQYGNYGVAFCNEGTCYGALTNKCWPNGNWNSTLTGLNAGYYSHNAGNFVGGSGNKISAYSVRCVTDEQECGYGYRRNKFGYCALDSTECDAGYQLIGSTCCPTVANCSTYDPSNNCRCTSCASGYYLNPSDGTCGTDRCRHIPGTVLVQNLCITEKNVGDDIPIPAEAGVTILNSASNCPAVNGKYKCCYTGQTTKQCNDVHGYTKCRVVCDWEATNAICKSLGNSCRMPVKSEFNAWTNDEVENILKICTLSTLSSFQCYGRDPGDYCKGWKGDLECKPGTIWGNDANSCMAFYLRDDRRWREANSSTCMNNYQSPRCVCSPLNQSL